jgi:hypothetical protein
LIVTFSALKLGRARLIDEQPREAEVHRPYAGPLSVASQFDVTAERLQRRRDRLAAQDQ